MPIGPGSLETLSLWNQVSPRSYTTMILCFELDPEFDDFDDIDYHLRDCLENLAESQPILASTLYADKETGLASLKTKRNGRIPFRVVEGETGGFDQSYAEMKAAGFPQSLFTDKMFFRDSALNDDGKPAVLVDAIIVDGGMFLHFEVHHAIFDGRMRDQFITALAAMTMGDRGDAQLPESQNFPYPRNPFVPRATYEAFEGLIAECPEYGILPRKNGPTQPCIDITKDYPELPTVGKIFSITPKRMEMLEQLIRARAAKDQVISTYSCLAALCFMCIVPARVKAETTVNSPDPGTEAMMHQSVNWRAHAMKDDKSLSDYFGVSTLPVFSKVPFKQLKAGHARFSYLAKLAGIAKQDVAKINDEYVEKRMLMFNTCPDPRLIGVNYDHRAPMNFAFNTWRHIGGMKKWFIPGLARPSPDAVRRSQPKFAYQNALILPQVGENQEILIQLPKVSMDELCKDKEFTMWFDIIE
ncbi:hypothetical protein BJ166DRAFT_503032 [Pestalotiopsis sp. NC0098]|nr:hypothetical protein BJ166DRAFT_503032 [Pestalotiopsis sp. NC0098]